jgi:hypothetical protein
MYASSKDWLFVPFSSWPTTFSLVFFETAFSCVLSLTQLLIEEKIISIKAMNIITVNPSGEECSTLLVRLSK